MRKVMIGLCAWYFLMSGYGQIERSHPFATEELCYQGYGAVSWVLVPNGWEITNCYTDGKE